MSRAAVMPTTPELECMGVLLATQGARMVIRDDGQLVLAGLTPLQRENVMVAWVGTWAAEWARVGFPAVDVDDNNTPTLFLDTPPADVEVVPPVPFFLIELAPVVVVRNSDGEREHVTRVLCMHLGGLWSYTALASRCELRRWQLTHKAMCCDEPRVDGDDPRLPGIPPDALDVLAYKLLSRVVINTARAIGGKS